MSSDQDEVTPHSAADAATAAVTDAVTAAATAAGEAPAAVAVLGAEDGTLSRRQVLVGAGGAGSTGSSRPWHWRRSQCPIGCEVDVLTFREVTLPRAAPAARAFDITKGAGSMSPAPFFLRSTA